MSKFWIGVLAMMMTTAARETGRAEGSVPARSAYVTRLDGMETMLAGKGIPAGVPHTFINSGSGPAQLVGVFASKHYTFKAVGPNPLQSVQPEIANPSSANDTHASLQVAVTKQGAVTVTNTRTGFTETYAPR